MRGITVVGLGPGDPRHLTREAWGILSTADEIWLRTNQHPTIQDLPERIVLHSFDYLYQQADEFPLVYESITDEVLALGRRPEGVIYAVPGHPLVGESTVQHLLVRAQDQDITIRIVEGLSFIAPTLTALGVDALTGLQICDALELACCYHPPLNPDVPGLIGQVYSRSLAADVKLTLMNQYSEGHRVVLVNAASTESQVIRELPLYEIDRSDEIAHLTTLFVPALPPVSSFEGFQDTVAHLRAPDGCPWDRQQTHESLTSSLLEEAYETITAIESGVTADLCEELGDLLLQVVLHAQIAVEDGEFSMAQVIAGIDAKLKHRHPHVWGAKAIASTDEVLKRWEELKRDEREPDRSTLDGVPSALPALQQANTYGERAARVGFDWPNTDGVVAKIHEEIAELQAAQTAAERLNELGDLLFAVVNWARWLDIDPESALRRANARFRQRFHYMEKSVLERCESLSDKDIDQLETLWQEAKQAEKPTDSAQ